MLLYLRIIFLLLLAVFNIEIINKICPLNDFIISDNVEESYKFRRLIISDDALRKIDEFCSGNNLDRNKVITTFLLKNDLELLKVNRRLLKKGKYKDLYKNYISESKGGFNKLKISISSIYSDIKYFPVAKSKKSDEWVTYGDSFGAKRTYNSDYFHEGTDVMADNNISGYFPIVSVCDGKIENIGWLEKGGYRVGVRSNSGAYFYYAHLSSYSDIKKGDSIKAGELLGYMGDTGYSTVVGTTGNFDVHLHFGIYTKTEHFKELSVNPYYILKYLENNVIIADY